MTQECEEQLIRDVSEVKALMKAHTKHHEETKTNAPVWIGIFASAGLSLFSLFTGVKP